jgi:hypothetical protein
VVDQTRAQRIRDVRGADWGRHCSLDGGGDGIPHDGAAKVKEELWLALLSHLVEEFAKASKDGGGGPQRAQDE